MDKKKNKKIGIKKLTSKPKTLVNNFTNKKGIKDKKVSSQNKKKISKEQNNIEKDIELCDKVISDLDAKMSENSNDLLKSKIKSFVDKAKSIKRNIKDTKQSMNIHDRECIISALSIADITDNDNNKPTKFKNENTSNKSHVK